MNEEIFCTDSRVGKYAPGCNICVNRMQKQPTTDPADFLKQVLGRPVVVQTTLTMTYRGILACLDPKMNLVLEKCEEIEDGEILNVFNETLVRGNNGEFQQLLPFSAVHRSSC